MKILCLFVIFFSGVINLTFGQNTLGLPQIINYSKDDYHGGSQTWGIAQDSSGKMYFANNEGLISFDGNYWKIYPLPNKTIVRSLSIDANRIYVGGQDEIGYFSPDSKGILKYTSLKTKIPEQYSHFADVWKIVAFKEAIFFQTSDKIFEYQNNAIKVFLPKEEWQFLGRSGGRLFADDKTGGLLEFKNNEWHPIENNKILNNAVVSGVIHVEKERLLLTTKKNGFFFLNNDSLSISDINPKIIASNQIYTSLKINPSEMVLGSTSAGCLFMDFKGNIIQKIATYEGLQNSNVLCVFRDMNNNIWVGLNNGISFIAYNSAIKFIKPNKSNEVSGYSSAIFNNKLFIATSDGVYSAPVYNSDKDYSFDKSDFTLIKNTAGEAWKLQEVNQHLLFGHNEGSFMIQNGESVPVAKGTGTWLFEPMSDVVPSKNILVGTYTGLKMLSYENNHFTDVGHIDGLYESFRFLAIDNDNTIWASHPYRGIYILHLLPDNKKFTYQLFTEKDGLPSTLENYVFKIKNKIVYATLKGVYEFNPATKSFSPSSFLSPIFHDMPIRYLKEDVDGDIWFCSGKKIGVVTFEKNSADKSFKITYFPELTGQILSGFENIYPYNKENVFISSEKGVFHLNYLKYAATKLQIKVLLGQVKAIGKKDSLIFGGYFNPANNFLQNQIYHLPKKYNSFHFEYSSPNYGLQKNIEYSYQLKGYDYKWSEWSPKTEKDYTNLPEGKYIFYVKAHDNLGHESDVISYTFYVKPSWYKTTWAYIGYLILFVLFVYLIFKWQEKKLDHQQIKFEQEQKRLEELHQLKLEKREKEIMKLQNEKLENEVKFKNKELANATMHLVERDSALIKVKDELQKLYKKTGNNHDIKKTLLLLDGVEQNNANWEQFVSHFNEVNNDFLRKLKIKYPSLSNTDIKVCTYLKLNLSSKEIAQLMNISLRGVEISRYRLRKKLEIPSGITLNDFLGSVV
jgi:ligand-binding sensor domain-containing protein/DNA-binding CsgD family transcriptional regulator